MNRTAKSTALPQDQLDVAFVQAGARVQDFLSLLKPRVMSLVVSSRSFFAVKSRSLARQPSPSSLPTSKLSLPRRWRRVTCVR